MEGMAEENAATDGARVKRRNAYRKLSDAPHPFAPTTTITFIQEPNNIVEHKTESMMISEEEHMLFMREWERGIVALKFGRKGPKQRKFQIDVRSGSLVCSHGFGNFAQPDLGSIYICI
jgi:hypothetical protein